MCSSLWKPIRPPIRSSLQSPSCYLVQKCHRPYIQCAGLYELGNGKQAIYLRGRAYLSARDGSKAVAEFQKIIDHRTLVLNYVGALAHLSLAHAYALENDTSKAMAACQDLLALWKNADADIPILKQAKAEYCRLL